MTTASIHGLEIIDGILIPDADSRGGISRHKTATTDPSGSQNCANLRSSAPNKANVLRYIHAYYDSSKASDQKNAYKFPHHSPTVGSAAIIPCVRNALSRLPQAKGIDSSAVSTIKGHLRGHIADAEGTNIDNIDDLGNIIDTRNNSHSVSGSEKLDRQSSILSPAIDIRIFPIEIREKDANGLPKTIIGRVITYGTVDAYGTIWRKGTFTDSLKKRLPPILWAHNVQEPIGRATKYQDTREGLILTFRFSDFTDVPRARQAARQLKDEDIDEFSVGFVRQEFKFLNPKKNNGAFEEVSKADLLEASVVPFGAVTGTEVVGMRTLFAAAGRKVYVPDRELIEVYETQEGNMSIEEEVEETRQAQEDVETDVETDVDDPDAGIDTVDQNTDTTDTDTTDTDTTDPEPNPDPDPDPDPDPNSDKSRSYKKPRRKVLVEAEQIARKKLEEKRKRDAERKERERKKALENSANDALKMIQKRRGKSTSKLRNPR